LRKLFNQINENDKNYYFKQELHLPLVTVPTQTGLYALEFFRKRIFGKDPLATVEKDIQSLKKTIRELLRPFP